MLKVKARPLTADDYRAVPEPGPRYQLIDGGMEMSPAPDRFHQDVSRNLVVMIACYLKNNPIGKVYDAPFDVYLNDVNVFQPDVIFVAKENAAILTEAGAEGAPDLVIEILSPKTARFDKGVKREVYARSGVKELWLIDPALKQVQVFNLRDDAETPRATYRNADNFESRLLPGLQIELGQVFAQ